MSADLPPDVVELVACAEVGPDDRRPALRETTFRADAWLPEETDRLIALFRADEPVEAIAAALGRGRAGVATRIGVLGLRRNSARGWTKLEDRLLVERYGAEATATIAGELGRSCAATYARAGFLGLTEGAPPPWTGWEDAQLRAGYADAVPVAQLATLIGRPASGVVSRASTLGLAHPNHPPDWTEAEAMMALDLADAGLRYARIAGRLAEAGYPRRSIRAFGLQLRKLGYGRGWGRAWTPEEDALLERAYGAGASLTPLRTRLGRSQHSIRWRAGCLGLAGTHASPHGFRAGPDWTEADEALLRAEYGRTPNPVLAARLGRTKGAMMCRANLLGLVHGYIRPFADRERAALDAAFAHGVAIADLAAALDRKACSVSKYATNHGLRFGRRSLRTSPPTIADILALATRPGPSRSEREGEAAGWGREGAPAIRRHTDAAADDPSPCQPRDDHQGDPPVQRQRRRRARRTLPERQARRGARDRRLAHRRRWRASARRP